MGTVKFWCNWVVKATRQVGDGDVEEVAAAVERFKADVAEVATAGKPTLEGNRSGICVSTFVRCGNMDEVKETIKNFLAKGWREGR